MSGTPITSATAALTSGAVATASSGSMPAFGSTSRLSGSSPTVSRPDVYAPMEEAALTERHLAGEAHEQRQPDGDERVQPHAVVETDVVRVELERGQHATAVAAAMPANRARSPWRLLARASSWMRSYRQLTLERQPMSTNMTMSAMIRLYCGSMYPTTSCSTIPSA